MKIAIIFLDYYRHDFTKQSLKSISNAGYAFDLFTIQEKGIAKAINIGIDKTRNYDAIITCANDIELPDNWLKEMVYYYSNISETGMIGIHCVENLGNIINVNELSIHKTITPFGNVLISRKAIDTIGYFNEDYDPYGMQDSDYGFRLDKTGFINYYLPNLKSYHLGHDVGNDTEYRKMKDEGLKLCDEKWKYWTEYYTKNNNYYIK